MSKKDLENNLENINSQSLLERIESFSKQIGITKWDLGASFGSDTSVQVDNGETKQMKSAERRSITIRVWNQKGLVGTSMTSNLQNKGLQKALELAHKASFYGNPQEIPEFSPLAKAPLADMNFSIEEPLGIKHLFETLKEAESKLISSHSSIKTVPYNGLAESTYERIYMNSDGALRQVKRSQSSIYLYGRAEEEGRKPRSSGAIRIASGTRNLDILGCINETSKRVRDHLNYQPIETGKYLICFTPEAFLELIGSFSSLFNARAILDGVSLSSKNCLGTKIAVPFLSLYDNTLNPANIGGSPFDGEGTPTQNICIINNGILENLLHSEATARAFNVMPTGHAGLGSKVSVGADWLEVRASREYDFESNNLHHKKTNETFVLVESLNALHAGVKPSQGSFSLPFDGWLVKQGEAISIEAATIAGDIKTVLENIIHIEKEEKITPQGVSPHVWVNELSITGEE